MASPYFSGNLSSGGFAVAPRAPGMGDVIANGLSRIGPGIASALMYDPADDPGVQTARLRGVQADAEKRALDGASKLAAKFRALDPADATAYRAGIGDMIATMVENGLATPDQIKALGAVSAMYGTEDAARTGAIVRGAGPTGVNEAYTLAGQQDIRDQNFGQQQRIEDTQQAGATERSRITSSAQAAASRYATDRGEATKRYIFDNTPVPIMQDGAPTNVSRPEAMGQRPVLPFDQERGVLLQKAAPSMSADQVDRVVGAEPKSRQVMNYRSPDGTSGTTYDGTTDAASGQPLAQGSTVYSGSVQASTPGDLTTSTRSDLQKQGISLEDFSDTLNSLEGIAKQDPTIFGTAGNVRRLWQAGVGQVKNISTIFGGDLDQQLATARSNADALGLRNLGAQFDPNLTDVEKMSRLAAYSAASALANQSGRSISDKDYQEFQRIIGDPTSWTSTQESFLAGLQRLRQEVTTKSGRVQRELGGGRSPAGGAPAQAPAAAAQRRGPPAPGEIVNGYRFKGGSPNDRANWEPAQ